MIQLPEYHDKEIYLYNNTIYKSSISLIKAMIKNDDLTIDRYYKGKDWCYEDDGNYFYHDLDELELDEDEIKIRLKDGTLHKSERTITFFRIEGQDDDYCYTDLYDALNDPCTYVEVKDYDDLIDDMWEEMTDKEIAEFEKFPTKKERKFVVDYYIKRKGCHLEEK